MNILVQTKKLRASFGLYGNAGRSDLYRNPLKVRFFVEHFELIS